MCEILGVQMFENHRANAQDFSHTCDADFVFMGIGVMCAVLLNAVFEVLFKAVSAVLSRASSDVFFAAEIAALFGAVMLSAVLFDAS